MAKMIRNEPRCNNVQSFHNFSIRIKAYRKAVQDLSGMYPAILKYLSQDKLMRSSLS